MKLTLASTALLAYALTMVSAAALPNAEPAPVHPDGAYASQFDAEGNEVVQFIPWNELGNKSFVPITTVIPASEVVAKREANPEPAEDSEHHALEKRKKEGCHAKSVTRDEWRINDANNCMYNSVGPEFGFTGGGNQKRSCVRSGVRSFICSYASAGQPTLKYRNDLRWTWDYIKNKVCPGTGRLGHSEIPNGYGLVSAGYTYDGDKYC